ncbi:MAG: DUF4190 domain-containing protein [Acidimicrobiia bacterium]|nr:DUF4190 domain-containing protein [Acidimicrobiia bacterium]
MAGALAIRSPRTGPLSTAAPPPPTATGYRERSRATTALVTGIVGLAAGLMTGVLILLCPVAWLVGQQELTAIDDGRRDPANRSRANAGRIMGIVGTALLVLSLLIVVVVLAVTVSDQASG